MTSIVIAAHNEAAVIGDCLDTLLAGARPDEFDITVVANGCTDDTARVAASRPGVRVLDLAEPGKARALNAGDAVATGFPRIYLDADIRLSADGVRLLSAALAAPPPFAAVPRRELDLAGRPLLVRAFYAINRRLPVYADGLFGRGAIAVSGAGRQRFGEFPEVMADDLFLDSTFTSAEKTEVAGVSSRIATPHRTRDLVRRLVRVRAGNAALRQAAGNAGSGRPVVRRASNLSWFRDVVLPRPWLAPAGACYAALIVTATVLARRSGSASHWGRDESTRQQAGENPRVGA